jgi:hypothetical protein
MNLHNLKQEEELGEAPPGAAGDPPTGEQPAPESAVENKWPDDWRQMYAGDDEKKLAYLSRYTDPAAAFDGGYATKLKLSSGEYKSTSPFPEKGTEDEQNAWREQNGIPSKATDYSFENIKEDDKGFVEAFQNFAHENNISPDNATKLVDFLQAQEESYDNQDKDADLRAQQTAEDQLRMEWGGDYRRNLNAIHGLFDTAPEGVKDAIFGGRLADGTAFGSNPEVSKFLAGLALQINPLSTVVNASGGNIISTIDDEIEAINTVMKEDPKKYYGDEKMQARWRELVTAKERMAG